MPVVILGCVGGNGNNKKKVEKWRKKQSQLWVSVETKPNNAKAEALPEKASGF